MCPAAAQAMPTQTQAVLLWGLDSVVVAVLALVSYRLMRGNRQLRQALREETEQRVKAEVELSSHRHELQRRNHRQATALHQLSFFDPLTELPNRSMLYEKLSTAVYSGRELRFALLLIDLDRFKAINEIFGHYIGDAILQEVGYRLKAAIPHAEMIAYLGGDEFAILHDESEAKTHQALDLASEIHKRLEVPFQIDGLPINVGASIGISYFPDHTADSDALLRYAEIAMYTAKRNQDDYAIYDPAQRQLTQRHLVLASELREAFYKEQLLLHFQPKVSIATGEVLGVEALARWNHPREGLLSPDKFVGLAEQTGLIRPFALWTLNSTLRTIADWRNKGVTLPVAVNLSPLNLQDVHFHQQVAELLEAWEIPGGLVEIEITETAAMADPENARAVLSRLNALGLGVAIDDFGTGYTSMAYLRQLPIDSIKIDKSFIAGLSGLNDNAIIVKAIVELAHNLGLSVVAEGLENQEHWDFLAGIGCDLAQGYWVCEPLASDQLLNWLEHRTPLSPPPAEEVVRNATGA